MAPDLQQRDGADRGGLVEALVQHDRREVAFSEVGDQHAVGLQRQHGGHAQAQFTERIQAARLDLDRGLAAGVGHGRQHVEAKGLRRRGEQVVAPHGMARAGLLQPYALRAEAVARHARGLQRQRGREEGGVVAGGW
jgi:hypothetical protein